jgi:hypothetical protein
MGNIGVAALAGLFVPVLVSFLKNVTWSMKVKQAVALGTSILVAVGITVVDKGVNLSDWKVLVANLAVIFTVAQVFYGQYFGGTALNAKLENVGVGAGKAVTPNA